MAQGARRRMQLVKVAVFVAALLPLLKLVADALLGRLGANPIAEAMNRLGFWTLTTLFATLACTPLNVMFGWTWPLQLRRMLGLFSFFYATMHVANYVVVDQAFDFGEILEDVQKRRFITAGFAAWLLLVPLALTSTTGWIRRLGGRRWRALHRLAYVAAALGVVHDVWRYKVLEVEPVVFMVVGVALGLVRLVAVVRRRRRARVAPARP